MSWSNSASTLTPSGKTATTLGELCTSALGIDDQRWWMARRGEANDATGGIEDRVDQRGERGVVDLAGQPVEP